MCARARHIRIGVANQVEKKFWAPGAGLAPTAGNSGSKLLIFVPRAAHSHDFALPFGRA
jgi:hypothetical protein